MKFRNLITIILIINSSLSAFAQLTDDSLFYDASYRLSDTSLDDKGNQFINVFSYNIDHLQIIPQKKLLRARARLKISSEKNLNSFYLDFHNSYKVKSLTVNGEKAKWKFEHGNNIYIKPKTPILKKNYFIVEINYLNTNEISDLWDNAVFEDDFVFTNLPTSLLFPSNEILRDRAFYRLNVSVPKDYKLVSFGKSIKRSKSNYYISTESTLSINNFTLSLLKGYDLFSIDGPRVSFGALAPKVKINQYTPIDSSVVFTDVIKYVPDQMYYLDSILGYYPYRNFNILITKQIIKNELYTSSRNTVIIPYQFTKDSIEVNNKILNGLVRQWFGNKINVRGFNDQWITKGISKYMEWLIMEQKVGSVQFNKMMNSKLVEARKYLGLIDWHQMNPYPIYSYDLSNVVYNFGELSQNKIIKGEELPFLFKVISDDIESVSDSVKNSFQQRFGHSLDHACEKGHSYYEIMDWAKHQKKGTFRISSDGFYTLKSMQENEFNTHTFELANPGLNNLDDFNIDVRGALFIHSLRLYFGDELFFNRLLDFATKYKGASLTTEFFVNELNMETNGEIEDVVNRWLYSDSEIPAFQDMIKTAN